MHIRDTTLIKNIKEFFKVGVYKESGVFCTFEVNSIKDLEIIINHFKIFPLQSSKQNAFNIFLIIFNMYRKK
jgi:hypothetical protein